MSNIKIALFGTFDVNNYGDCLFPFIVKKAFARAELGDFEIDLFSPSALPSKMTSGFNYTQISGNPNDQSFEALLRSYDVLLLAGGDTVWSGERKGTYSILPYHSMSAGFRLWGWIVHLSRNFGAIGILLAPGVGTLSSHSLAYIREGYNYLRYISFRDHNSARKIDSSIAINPDIAFSLVDIYPIHLLKERFESAISEAGGAGQYIVCQISFPYLTTGALEVFVNNVAKIASHENKNILLLPICHFLDDHILLAIVKNRLESVGVRSRLFSSFDVEEILAVLANSGGYIGTSLHGAISTFSYGKKIVLVSGGGQSKHKGVFSVINSVEFVAEDPGSNLYQRWVDINLDDLKSKSNTASSLALDVFEKVKVLILNYTGKRDCCSDALFYKVHQLELNDKNIYYWFSSRIQSLVQRIKFIRNAIIKNKIKRRI